MLTSLELTHIALVGVGATVVLDLWLLMLSRLGIPAANFALIGRWIAYMARGRFQHAPISQTPPAPFERLLGWLTHYVVGIAYAAMLVSVMGLDWLRHPSLAPALAFGLATVLVPLLVMQPAMGSGFASSKTPAPLRNCLRSLQNHAVFGDGLYLTAAALALT